MSNELNVADEVYESKLRHLLWSRKFDDGYDPTLINLLLKISNVDLQNITDKELISLLNESELKLLKDIKLIELTENKELVARWYDSLLTLEPKKLFQYVKLVTLNYWDVFIATTDYKYLSRYLTLIKYCKSAFNAELPGIFDVVKPIITNLKSAFWQYHLLKELVSIFSGEACKAAFAVSLNEQLRQYIAKIDSNSARFIVQSLGLIKELTSNDCHIKTAEIYEIEADHYVSTKKPNTYYPTISETYYKALAEIKSVENCEDLRKRLESKIQPELKLDFNMVQSAGVKATPEIPYEVLHSNINKLDIYSYESAYHMLLALPFPRNEKILEQVEKDRSQGLSVLFSEHQKINSKGAKVGASAGDEALISNVRGYYREVNITYIQMLKQLMDVYGNIAKGMVFNLVEQSRSAFIPEDRIFIFAQGLWEGFDNNFIAAAHLLTPQLENSFRQIASINGITVTTFDNKIQQENILGGILEKIRPITNLDLHDELKSFLNEPFSVNFRNELSHGLMNTVLLQHYGRYTWWLTLKLIFQTEDYFKLASN